MVKPKPIRRSLNWMFIEPFKQPFRLTRAIFSNLAKLVSLSKRGASRNFHRYAPLAPGMDSSHIRRLDRWWHRQTPERRTDLFEQYQDWIVAQSILAEAQRSESGQRYWSLSPSPERRRQALKRQRPTYIIWSVLFLVGFLVITALALTRETSVLFWLMSACFLVFLFPEVARHRATQAQLLYGRKVSVFEVFSPLPKDMLIDEELEERYKRQQEHVLTVGVTRESPIMIAYRKEALGQDLSGDDHEEY